MLANVPNRLFEGVERIFAAGALYPDAADDEDDGLAAEEAAGAGPPPSVCAPLEAGACRLDEAATGSFFDCAMAACRSALSSSSMASLGAGAAEGAGAAGAGMAPPVEKYVSIAACATEATLALRDS